MNFPASELATHELPTFVIIAKISHKRRISNNSIMTTHIEPARKIGRAEELQTQLTKKRKRQFDKGKLYFQWPVAFFLVYIPLGVI